ncbi:hypothetical protein V8G54_033341 [Vigna mungo]|uniref:Uncharacterized protein n=1 Tax=Vigna mungo TaxID=3915 RepID=A0AAQ3MNV0_VIGMU
MLVTRQIPHHIRRRSLCLIITFSQNPHQVTSNFNSISLSNSQYTKNILSYLFPRGIRSFKKLSIKGNSPSLSNRPNVINMSRYHTKRITSNKLCGVFSFTKQGH